jgi:hypothetical protein
MARGARDVSAFACSPKTAIPLVLDRIFEHTSFDGTQRRMFGDQVQNASFPTTPM